MNPEPLSRSLGGPTPADKPHAPVTFVCCIEHGRLEAQTLLMIKSLRRFGGALADAPVMAVIGRTGAPLRSRTHEMLGELGVRIVRAERRNPASWFNYANKVVAVAVAEEYAGTPQVAWLDSDILVAGDLRDLALAPHECFAARGEWLPPAVFENDPSSAAHLPYWAQLCRLLGTEIEALPWIEVMEGKPRIRAYFNSGVFVWRRGCGFAPAYFDAFCRLLRSRLAQKDRTFFSADQVILGPVVFGASLPWRHLERRHHHMTFQAFIDGPDPSPPMTHASVIHYSRSLDPSHRDRFMRRLATETPALATFLQDQAHQLALPAPHWHDTVRATMLRAVRGLRWRLYAHRVTETIGLEREQIPSRVARPG